VFLLVQPQQAKSSLPHANMATFDSHVTMRPQESLIECVYPFHSKSKARKK